MKITLKTFTVLPAVMLAMAMSLHAVDISGCIHMNGNLVRQSKDANDKNVYSFLENNKKLQKDDDAIEFTVDAGIAGAHIAMWYETETQTAEDDWNANFRRTYVWFKPVDMIKIQLGYSGNDQFFKEKVDEWKVGNPFALAERDWSKHPAYINCNDVEGWGFACEVYPMDGLILNAACAPKGSNPQFEKGEGASDSYAPWGAGARYYWSKLAFQASYRDGGKDNWKVARFGVGYEGENLFGFVQPVFGIDYNSTKEKYETNGLCLDLYGEYKLNSLKFILHAPLTFRWSGATGDCNYMEFCGVAKYNLGSYVNMDDITPYLKLRSISCDDDKIKYSAWMLDENFTDSFNMTVATGVEFKVGACELDVSYAMDFYSKFDQDYGRKCGSHLWSIPFTAKMMF